MKKCDTDICAEMESDGEMALKKYIDLQPTELELDALVALVNEGVLEIIKEVIPESGKTKYICKLKILDD